jgi:hypothetical protein
VTFTDHQCKQIEHLVRQNRLLDARAIIRDAIESQVGGVAKRLSNVDYMRTAAESPKRNR